jgi:uncharacterized membrane protein YeiB
MHAAPPFGVPDMVRSGSVTALDAETATSAVAPGHRRPWWRVSLLPPGLVFTGELYGDVLALYAATGMVRWRWTTSLPSVAKW